VIGTYQYTVPSKMLMPEMGTETSVSGIELTFSASEADSLEILKYEIEWDERYADTYSNQVETEETSTIIETDEE